MARKKQKGLAKTAAVLAAGKKIAKAFKRKAPKLRRAAAPKRRSSARA
jgi:hypothetical protein